ncbi:hypothetical protein FNH22_07545 [Fulvivirga sp. M361]|uniref:hypothetical protein n=1 Tax=Fulvivirga sp. M361 TaxID=2594266 RepID=UPI00117AC7FB|nr:hypothetical protein [Fulvivirga sp. M361]TRX59899.1 hypothetical protein FNH22_07545 [Fulvivirga sp. M361]
MRGLALTTLLITLFFSTPFAQKINRNWNQDLQADMSAFKDCANVSDNGLSCNQYPGKSLSTVYGLKDFYSASKKRYLSVVEISEYLKTNAKWEELGHAYEPDVLQTAQERANKNRASVAIYINEEGEGHMVVIVPGELKPSGSWGLKVPASTSFFAKSPEKSYLTRGLSYAFPKNLIKNVFLYGRKY